MMYWTWETLLASDLGYKNPDDDQISWEERLEKESIDKLKFPVKILDNEIKDINLDLIDPEIKDIEKKVNKNVAKIIDTNKKKKKGGLF